MLSSQDLSFERFPGRCWNVRLFEIAVSSSSRASRGISTRGGGCNYRLYGTKRDGIKVPWSGDFAARLRLQERLLIHRTKGS